MQVDDTLRSLCREIAHRNLTVEEWLREEEEHDSISVDRAPYTCLFLGDPENPDNSVFFIEREIRDYPHCAELPLDTVVAIARNETNDVSFVPRGGSHPEDNGMNRIELDTETIGHAISDAINIYVREILVPRGVVHQDAWDTDKELIKLKYEIAEQVAQKWKVSWRANDDAPTDGT